MNLQSPRHALFHLLGERPAESGEPDDVMRFRPAQLARYRDLASLRHDYPLVLREGGPEPLAAGLSSVVGGVARQLAPQGADGEALRRLLLRLEYEVRAQAMAGTKGSLRMLWNRAEKAVLEETESGATHLKQDLRTIRRALPIKGRVVGCNADTLGTVARYAWDGIQANKVASLGREIEKLVTSLRETLDADHQKTAAARTPKQLERDLGDSYRADIDFNRLSQLLPPVEAGAVMPKERRARILAALKVLEEQRFLVPAGASERRGRRSYRFVFERCGEARAAFRKRLPKLVDLVKAMTLAELEIANRYQPEKHDAHFARFDETHIEPEYLARFPAYLVHLHAARSDAVEMAVMTELLEAGLPFKFILESDDLLAEQPVTSGRFSLGARGTRLAGMTLCTCNAFVLQAPVSHLRQHWTQFMRAMNFDGPALIHMLSTEGMDAPHLPTYLKAAAALQARAFPAFSFDPAAGGDWASRFSVAGNPQPTVDWPVDELDYEDDVMRREAIELAFTFVDFAVLDARQAHHFAAVPRNQWHDGMIPVADYLAAPPDSVADRIPYILAADENDVIHRLVVEKEMILAALRCLDAWHSLRELGGIANSHAAAAVAASDAAWQDRLAAEIASHEAKAEPEAPAKVAAQPAAAPAPAAEPEEPEEEARPVGDPYIDTPRCTTCNECTQLNDRMFAYNENMQAYIADPDAGSFKQLVEAAENCQVSIIHPGNPRNPDEDDLEALIDRAEPFN